MNAELLLASLSARGIVLTFDRDVIEVDSPFDELTDEDILTLRNNKPALLWEMRSRCRPHNDPKNYIDVPDVRRQGWVRSTCRLCGRFVGYRRSSHYTR